MFSEIEILPLLTTATRGTAANQIACVRPGYSAAIAEALPLNSGAVIGMDAPPLRAHAQAAKPLAGEFFLKDFFS